MVEISAVIITKNEAGAIAACLQSLAGVADEVLVVDDHSTDDTLKIATNLGARVLEHTWEGYGAQKNFGASQASFDWILSIDADEQLSETLRQTIIRRKQQALNGVYGFNRLNFIGLKAIRFGAWYPDRKIRLYDRRKTEWSLAPVHEKLIAKKDNSFAPVTILAGDLLHFSYKDVDDMNERSARYAERAAAIMVQRHTKHLVLKMLVHPAWKGFRSFVLKAGFLDGAYGWAVSRHMVKETYLKYYLAWKKR
ncbi:MAG: glycosyltransferase family 2 protein [Chitinophagales bacterium]